MHLAARDEDLIKNVFVGSMKEEGAGKSRMEGEERRGEKEERERERERGRERE